jgi:hypothetical protein
VKQLDEARLLGDVVIAVREEEVGIGAEAVEQHACVERREKVLKEGCKSGG